MTQLELTDLSAVGNEPLESPGLSGHQAAFTRHWSSDSLYLAAAFNAEEAAPTTPELSPIGSGAEDPLLDSGELLGMLLADASDQATLLLRRTTDLTAELTLKAHEEAHAIEADARLRAEAILSEARDERRRLVDDARNRATRIDLELTQRLSELRTQNTAECRQLSADLNRQRTMHLNAVLAFLDHAGSEVARLRELASADLARAKAVN